jgi:hypothetical protein
VTSIYEEDKEIKLFTNQGFEFKGIRIQKILDYDSKKIVISRSITSIAISNASQSNDDTRNEGVPSKEALRTVVKNAGRNSSLRRTERRKKEVGYFQTITS